MEESFGLRPRDENGVVKFPDDFPKNDPKTGKPWASRFAKKQYLPYFLRQKELEKKEGVLKLLGNANPKGVSFQQVRGSRRRQKVSLAT
ncbi:MAG: hypothetical protein WC229_01860 [Candidatus Paceibacterota bacterium]|jgi:hypothetical protein